MVQGNPMSKHHKRHKRSAPGAAPGTLTENPHARASRVTAMRYNAEGVFEPEGSDLPCPEPGSTLWLNVDGLADTALLTRIGEAFSLHPLALEDVVNIPQRPKTEDYGTQHFVVLQMPAPATSGFHAEQVSLLLGETYVVTFQEQPGDVFDPVRARLRNPERAIRGRGADYLLYALIDAIIDAYFPILDALGDKLEALEDAILTQTDRVTMGDIHALKRELGAIRNAVWPLRDVVTALMREDQPRVGELTRLYLRDCLDHVNELTEMAASQRDIATGLVDMLLSAQAQRTNEVMRVLTLISTIFIPLTFIAGVYGMNFDAMPELRARWGYPAVMGVMGAIAAGLLVWFRLIGWLGRR